MQKHRTMKRSALALAIGMTIAGGSFAQSNSVGYIFGQADGGGSVVVENIGTGTKREIGLDNDGNFRASALPTGRYRVTYNGKSREVTVNVGAGSAVNFSDASTLEVVEVTGGAINAIDLSSVESTTIMTGRAHRQDSGRT